MLSSTLSFELTFLRNGCERSFWVILIFSARHCKLPKPLDSALMYRFSHSAVFLLFWMDHQDETGEIIRCPLGWLTQRPARRTPSPSCPPCDKPEKLMLLLVLLGLTNVSKTSSGEGNPHPVLGQLRRMLRDILKVSRYNAETYCYGSWRQSGSWLDSEG